jgi:hypothetical protein
VICLQLIASHCNTFSVLPSIINEKAKIVLFSFQVEFIVAAIAIAVGSLLAVTIIGYPSKKKLFLSLLLTHRYNKLERFRSVRIFIGKPGVAMTFSMMTFRKGF